jgi:hypothetical protein
MFQSCGPPLRTCESYQWLETHTTSITEYHSIHHLSHPPPTRFILIVTLATSSLPPGGELHDVFSDPPIPRGCGDQVITRPSNIGYRPFASLFVYQVAYYSDADLQSDSTRYGAHADFRADNRNLVGQTVLHGEPELGACLLRIACKHDNTIGSAASRSSAPSA